MKKAIKTNTIVIIAEFTTIALMLVLSYNIGYYRQYSQILDRATKTEVKSCYTTEDIELIIFNEKQK